jgi:hypothetical protein
MEKDLESSKARGNKSLDRISERRSDDRHHQHSLEHSSRRSHNSASHPLLGSIRINLG